MTWISNTDAARNASPLRENIEKQEVPKVAEALAPASWTPWLLLRSLRVPRLRFSFWVCGRRIFAHQDTDEAVEEPTKTADLIARRTGYRGTSAQLCDLVQKDVIDLSRCGILIGHGGRCILGALEHPSMVTRRKETETGRCILGHFPQTDFSRKS